MAAVWDKKIKNSEPLKKYAAARSALFTPIHGEEAEKESFKMVRYSAWLYFDGGKAVRELGLPQTSVEEALERAVRWFDENGYVRTKGRVRSAERLRAEG